MIFFVIVALQGKSSVVQIQNRPQDRVMDLFQARARSAQSAPNFEKRTISQEREIQCVPFVCTFILIFEL